MRRVLRSHRVSNGFTLIELLVVVSIIALLLSILVPALRLAKEKAMTVSCLSNLRNIMMAWQMYTVDNHDKLVNGYVLDSYMRSAGGPGGWVEPPQDDSGTPQTNIKIPVDYRYNGIRKGLLYRYLETVDVYHCPADIRFKKGNSQGFKVYVTYTVADGAVGYESTTNSRASFGYQLPKKIQEVESPARKYVLIEAAYDGGPASGGLNYNDYSWNLDYNGSAYGLGVPTLWDPMGMYHSDSSTLSFADGHVDIYKFKDKDTVKFFLDRKAYGTPPSEKDKNEDVRYFYKGWPGISLK